MDSDYDSNYILQTNSAEDDEFNNSTSSNDDNKYELEIYSNPNYSGSSPTSKGETSTGLHSNNARNDFLCNADGQSGCSNDNLHCSQPRIEPSVPENFIPKKGAKYSSVDEAIDMYRIYASLSGFGVRLGTENLTKEKTFHSRYVRCNRYGQHQSKKSNVAGPTLNKKTKRQSFHKVCGCKARITIHIDKKTGMYEISKFEPIHNHELLQGHDEDSPKTREGISYMDRDFIMKASTLNIGPIKAFKLKACFKGGYHKLRTSKNAFKNFWRDYTSIIGPKDAQCVVDQLSIRKKTYSKFFFKYREKGPILDALFWADEVAKENYTLFSDVISMDATYRTNRYKLIFVPFTAINNHNKSVHVGAALLSDETIDSYTWLLEAFLEAHGHAPKLIMTDQDPALIQSITNIFTDSTHRLCMWHIMSKIPHKITADVVENTTFKKHLHQLVWSIYLDIEEFEDSWGRMISEFRLEDNKWLHDMYRIREKWIPAYFRHIPRCGLMKTTSRSESSNSFFNVFTNTHSLLVNFMFNFDTTITKQRYEQNELDISTNTTTPSFVSDEYNKHLELHTASIYTRNMFSKVQKEIRKALTLCFQRTSQENDGMHESIIVFKNPKNNTKREFLVTNKESYNSVECSCRCFNNFGYLCCHAFRVLLNNDIKQIPEKYIAKRWQRNITELSPNKMAQKWGVFNNETTQLVEEATTYLERLVDKVVHDKDKLRDLIFRLKELDLKLGESISQSHEENKTRQYVEQIVGVEIGKKIDIENPSSITNKGGDRRTRLKSAREKAIASDEAGLRRCQGCKQYAKHDKRNCPANPSKNLKPHKKIMK